ncbi:HAMP domain-containing histidine kinase [Aliarcobacter cryaerophilus]|uniref:sensor histidine kinase n=1 Tax=Aliarcobacter cryaerophilus TaxID=28198 RepID=UPI0021B678CF|nr:HAMP domain-containing sensor histidine kinase [Aliarcobacter cryaerophilus]MCT7485543.1 HAMP domain-containing histidine kinase [Aliarcobacter cryaerophilus]MCT7491370.1 HAMP domain-containing histidine kinase [Aliarcobacter cryaerophilus]
MIRLIKNMNIKVKLGILFFVLCISIVILGYKTIAVSEDNQITLKDVHSKSQAVLSLQNNIINPLYNLRQLNHSLVMSPNSDIRKGIQLEIDEIVANLDLNFNEAKKFDYEIYEIWNNYKKLFFQTKEFLDEQFEEGAYINITTVTKKQFDILIGKILDLQKTSLNNSTIAYSNAIIKTKDIKLEVFLIIATIFLFAVIIGTLISRNIIKSIYTVQNGLNDFFKYLNDKKTKLSTIELSSNDEFKQMASIINENVLYISKNIEQNEALIKNATKILENIKIGNLGTRLSEDTNDTALNELKNMINDVIENLESRIKNEIDQRLAQEQILIQQSKLAAMGEMIGNIAHQWRQPLAQISAIHMNMKVTYDFNKFDEVYLNEKIKEANKLTSYMSQTINDFQNFFIPQKEKEIFSIEKACKDAYNIIDSSLKYHNIEINFNIKEDTNIFGYKNEFSQVILNILSNAKDILIERKIENPKIDIEVKNGDNYSIIKIHDNAGGVKDDILDKIFDPYFTTRHKTQGTGIGLYMAKNIIERNMSGFINVKNIENGALFTIKVLKDF